MPRKYELKDLKLLWGSSAARCAFPQCRCELVAEATPKDPAAVVGEIAHIHGLNPGTSKKTRSARFDPSLADAERNLYANLVLLCPTHHTLVDEQGSTYTADNIRTWKEDLEQWVRDRLREELPSVGFAELEVVTKGLLAKAPSSFSGDFDLLGPTEKMARNSLQSDSVKFELTLGLSKAREVELFVDDIAKVILEFPENLKQGFVIEYRRLISEGYQGEALYFALRDFAATGSSDFTRQAAGLAVLAYLFEKCEVFEK